MNKPLVLYLEVAITYACFTSTLFVGTFEVGIEFQKQESWLVFGLGLTGFRLRCFSADEVMDTARQTEVQRMF